MNTLVEPIYIYSIHEPEAVLTNDIANLLFETTMHVIRLFPYVARNEILECQKIFIRQRIVHPCKRDM